MPISMSYCLRRITLEVVLCLGIFSYNHCLSEYLDNRNNIATHIGDLQFNSLNAEEKLLQTMNRSDLTTRPRHSAVGHGPITVNVSYNIIQLLSFAQADEILNISGWFTIMWTDFRLRWNPKEYENISKVFMPTRSLWLPDIALMNGRSDHNFDFSTHPQSRVSIDSDGIITWIYGAVLDVTCRLDVTYFPFDTQICYLIITPWQTPKEHFILKPVFQTCTVDNKYLPNANISEWSILDVNYTHKDYKNAMNDEYQFISIGIKLKRQPLYFVILVIVPFSMLSLLASLIFVLDNTGDRLAVAVSLVLSMTMYVVIVSSSAPRSMRTLPVICIYLLNQLGLLSVATVLAVFNQKMKTDLHKMNELDKINKYTRNIVSYNKNMEANIPLNSY